MRWSRRLGKAGQVDGLPWEGRLRGANTFLKRGRERESNQPRPFPAGAWRLWSDPSQRSRRWLVEACILGAMPTSEIATRLKLNPKVLEWYEFLFYDVRPFLVCPQFVIICDILFGRPDDAADEVNQDEVAWKLCALTLGTEAFLELQKKAGGAFAIDWLVSQRGAERHLVQDIEHRMQAGQIPFEKPEDRKAWDRHMASMSGLSRAAGVWRSRGRKDMIRLSQAQEWGV